MGKRLFESVTKTAIEEMIRSHTKESKFGFILTAEGFQVLLDDLHNFFLTSRSLKAAGDKLLTLGPPTQPTSRGPVKRIPRESF